MTPEIENQIKKLQDLIDVQADAGNWDYDPYMHGMLNGMLLSRCLLDGKDPDFKNAPERWLRDFEILEKLNKSGVLVNEDNTDSNSDKE